MGIAVSFYRINFNVLKLDVFRLFSILFLLNSITVQSNSALHIVQITFFNLSQVTMIILHRIKLLSVFLFSFKRNMVWSEKHDILLCREVISTDPFTDIKKGTTQRNAKWTAIAEVLVSVRDIDVPFRVDKRGAQ